jgi:hypothetical protein
MEIGAPKIQRKIIRRYISMLCDFGILVGAVKLHFVRTKLHLRRIRFALFRDPC